MNHINKTKTYLLGVSLLLTTTQVAPMFRIGAAAASKHVTNAFKNACGKMKKHKEIIGDISAITIMIGGQYPHTKTTIPTKDNNTLDTNAKDVAKHIGYSFRVRSAYHCRLWSY